MFITNLTVSVIIMLVAYILGAITKIFIDTIPNRLIPIQNVIVGLVSGFICYYMKLEPSLMCAIVTCLIATMGAGGISDLIKINSKNKTETEQKK